jgi:hypothetical protein
LTPHIALPSGLTFLEWEGRRVYPVGGCSGGTSSLLISYIVQTLPSDAAMGRDFGRKGLHEEAGGRWYAVEFSCLDSVDQILEKFNEGIRVLQSK